MEKYENLNQFGIYLKLAQNYNQLQFNKKDFKKSSTRATEQNKSQITDQIEIETEE